jgi:hypothetical protein
MTTVPPRVPVPWRTYRREREIGHLCLAGSLVIVAGLIDFLLSRWLLEGARPQMVVAWWLTGGLIVLLVIWLGLVWLCALIVDTDAP